MIIIGAGMAGLIAAHFFRSRKPTVLERQASLPDNHGAVLRFRTDAIGRIVGVPLVPVQVRKAVLAPNGELHNFATLRDSNLYSYKVTGAIQDRSILNLDPVQRYIAPPDFLARMAEGVNILYNREFIAEPGIIRPVTISTIPLPAWVGSLGLGGDAISFESREIQTIEVDIKAPALDVHQTVYCPNFVYEGDVDAPSLLPSVYRCSITGSRLIIELVGCPTEFLKLQAEEIINFFLWAMLGQTRLKASAPKIREQKFGKIVPLETSLRRTLIQRITDEYDIYSLGRFATWRQVLLDDLVRDCEVIQYLLAGESGYRRRKFYGRDLSTK